jgi:hypothetical protein
VSRDVYVSIPPSLTAPVEIVELEDNDGTRNADTLQLGAAYRAQKVRAKQCNGKLAEIAAIGRDDTKPEGAVETLREDYPASDNDEDSFYFTDTNHSLNE